MEMTTRPGETFPLQTRRTGCGTFPLRVYGSSVQAALARLRRARARRVSAGAASLAPGGSCPGPGWPARLGSPRLGGPSIPGDGSQAEVETAFLV